MHRKISFALPAVLLVLLILSVITQVLVLPSEVKNVVEVFPEVDPIAVPSIIWGVLAIACWQVAAVIGLKIIHLARDHGLDASNYGWIQAMIVCMLTFALLVVAAFITLNVMGYATPGVMLGLIGAGILAMIAAGSLALFLGTRPLARQYWKSSTALPQPNTP